MKITLFSHLKYDVSGQLKELPPHEMFKFLQTTYKAQGKNKLPQFSPTLYQDNSRAKRSPRIELSLLALDVDEPLEPGAEDKKPRYVKPMAIHRILKNKNITHIIYSTWSYKKEEPRYRVIIWLNEPIPADDWKRYVPHTLEHLGLSKFTPIFDKSCLTDVARMLRLPHQDAKFKSHWGLPVAIEIPPEPEKPPVVPLTCSHDDKYVEAALKGEISAVSSALEGKRNRQLNKSAYALGQLVATGKLSEDLASRELLEAARVCGLNEREARTVIEQGMEAGAKKPRTMPDKPVDLATRPSKPLPNKPRYPDTREGLLKRYYYVTGMNRIYDTERHVFMSVDDLKNTFKNRIWYTSQEGKSKPVDFFKCGDRTIIHSEDIRFAPGEKLQLPYLNLFTKYPHQDAKRNDSKCEHILTLLHHLCGEHSEWVLKWLAYPLKYPGAKMRSALVVHGKQGNGKSLLFGVAMRSVYGQWATTITQTDLESGWNAWISCKCYAIAEEVGHRNRGKFEVSNLLKHWITNGTVEIHQKYMPRRVEENHCNLVFISNDSMPVAIDPDDRRFCVIRTNNNVMEQEFYTALVKELRNGGSEAWYKYLQEYPVSRDFIDERPPETEAKADLKELCATSPEEFVSAWKSGEFRGVPYIPAKSSSLYRVYCIYCERYGYSRVSIKQFVSIVKHRCDMKAGKLHGSRIRYLAPPEVALVTADHIDEFEVYAGKMVD